MFLLFIFCKKVRKIFLGVYYALLFFGLYRCSTRSLISCVRPWFQNWVPM